MKNSDELRDELQDSPFLKKMKEQPGEGFKVPKHYFKHLPDEVWKLVKPAPATLPSRPSWLENLEMFFQGLFQPRYALALATLLVLVVATVVFIKDKNDGAIMQPIAQVSLEDITDEELVAYVSDNIGDFDRGLMLEISEPELPEVEQQTKPSTKTEVAKPNVEEMEEYLDEMIDEIDVEDLEKLL